MPLLQLPTTVHYLWCKEGYLGFHHYLGVLSAIRHLQPLKFIVHFKQLPVLDHDMYYSWFIVGTASGLLATIGVL